MFTLRKRKTLNGAWILALIIKRLYEKIFRRVLSTTLRKLRTFKCPLKKKRKEKRKLVYLSY